MSLYDFQRTGVQFLRDNKRAYLADEQGLGKTVQAVVAATYLRTAAGHALRPLRTVIVCPASVKEHWRREWAVWAPPPMQEPEIVSWAMVSRRVLGEAPDLVILDEAHYAKTPSAQRTRAALRLAKQADRAWLLSGTPMPNDPTELYAVMKALWPDHFLVPMTKHQFMDRYCTWYETEYGPKVTGLSELGRTELPKILRLFVLRRKLGDVKLELPPLRVNVQYLPRDARVEEKINQAANMEDDPEILATQRRLLGQYKAPAIADVLIEELKADPKLQMVVLYHHRNTGEMLATYFAQDKITITGFDGRYPLDKRQEAIDRFQAGKARVFLAQQTAAGIGITLTAASEIVLVEPSWSPADNEQAIKRIHRIGQEHPCRARIFAQPGTLDEALMATLLRKTKMLKGVGL